MKNFPLHRAAFFALCIVLLSLSGCDMGEDNEDPVAKSLRLRTEAAQDINQNDYLHAEQLLSQTLPLDRQLQQWDRLAEDQSTSARVEASLGYFSLAIEHYTEAWKYYRQAGDRATEVRLMNGMGNIYIGLGDFEKGIGTLRDALDVSRLASNNQPDPETAMNLGNAYLWTGQFENALDQFGTALTVYNKKKYAPAIVRALSRVGYASALLGKRDESLGEFSNVENIVRPVVNVLVKGRFYYDRGKALQSLEEWTAAAQSFHNGIDLLESLSSNERNAQTSELLTLLYTALGKVYSHNFAFSLARQSFIEAYSLAKDAGRKIATGYLLIAIADCERNIVAVNPAQESAIAATTYYEQAITLFSRIGYVTGEAYANYRLGTMKEGEGNTEAALNFYRRAFELCSAENGEFNDWGINEEFFGLREPHSRSGAQETFWYEPLVVTLARQGRAQEALWVYEQGKTKSLSAQIRSFPLEFRDKEAEQRVQSFERRSQDLHMKEAELSFQRGLDAGQRDGQRIAALQQELFSGSTEQAAAALTQKYPALEILFRTPTLQEADLRSSLPYGTVVADYLIADDRIVIFVISFDGMGRQMPVSVVEVPAYKDIVLEKVHQYDTLLREHNMKMEAGFSVHKTRPGETTDLDRLSQELYNYFLRPVERLFVQRVVVVPPREMDRVPFHSFTRSTNEGVKPLIEFADVSYLPYLAAVKSMQAPPRLTNAVVVVGNPRGNNWPLDFELRDVRSFFREAIVSVSQNANEKQLFSSFGDVLQLSTDFATDTLFPAHSTFVLSSGSITNPDEHIPIADFLQLHPFPIVYLSDQQTSASGLTPLHAVLLMMNGSSHVIMNMSPSETKAQKFFSERFYSTLAKGGGINEAYRAAVVSLSKSKNFSAPYQWSQFFMFGK